MTPELRAEIDGLIAEGNVTGESLFRIVSVVVRRLVSSEVAIQSVTIVVPDDVVVITPEA